MKISNRIMNLILTKKHEAWCNSIEDEAVKALAQKNTIITGGAISSMLLKEEINDFDLYFANFETCLAIAQYYVAQFIKEHNNISIVPKVMADVGVEGLKDRVHILIQSVGISGDLHSDEEEIELIENPVATLEKADSISADSIGSLHGANTEKGKYRPVFLTDNAITLSDKVQLIIRFYGDAQEIHKNFDFVHCMNYWKSDTRELVLKQEALESLLSKKLFYTNSQYPICALIRIRKFLKRGFSIDAGQILKICFQISKLDLENVEILADQLVGVDTGYFSQLINYIREEKAKDANWILELPYLVSIIDKIF